jgi:hypothetical protein
MDAGAAGGAHSSQCLAVTGGVRRETAVWMWVWIIGFIALVVLAAKMLDRRGSTGPSRRDDLPGSKDGRPKRIDTDSGWGPGI